MREAADAAPNRVLASRRMRAIRATVVAALATLMLAAGCGGDGGDDENGGTPAQRTETQGTETGGREEPVGGRGGRGAAEAFVTCFDKAGFEAMPLRGTQDPTAFVAKRKGYDVTSFLLNPEKPFEGGYARFFASEAKRKEATREPDLNFGSADVPATDERGSAVVTYLTKDARKALKSAIDGCLG
jgi:hypothetical protein